MPSHLAIKFNSDGLVPAIVQQASGSRAGRVLMLAWMNQLALDRTIATGQMHYWSRSRGKLWFKGETSGHTQKFVRWFIDCDADTLLFEVEQEGAACHTGYESCFFQEVSATGEFTPVAEEKCFDPAAVYTQ